MLHRLCGLQCIIYNARKIILASARLNQPARRRESFEHGKEDKEISPKGTITKGVSGYWSGRNPPDWGHARQNWRGLRILWLRTY
jgi:hypothetical protein